jgi:hypothetical protein
MPALGRYFAIADRKLSDGTRENALFSTSTCYSWERVSIPEQFRYNAYLNSIDYVSGRWFISGVSSRPSEADVPLLAAGTALRKLTMLNLSIAPAEKSRGIYAVGRRSNKAYALLYNFGLSTERSDVSVPMTFRWARGIKIPAIGLVHRSGTANVVQ